MKIWHNQIDERQEPIVAVSYARSWRGTGIREHKRQAVVEGLTALAQRGYEQLKLAALLDTKNIQHALIHCVSNFWVKA